MKLHFLACRGHHIEMDLGIAPPGRGSIPPGQFSRIFKFRLRDEYESRAHSHIARRSGSVAHLAVRG